MAYPHTAFTETVGGTGTVTYYKTRSGVKQTTPINKSLALPYTLRMARTVNRGETFVAGGDTYFKQDLSANGQPGGLADWTQIDAIFPRSVTAAKNKCYEKFLNELSARASLGETLAELGKSATMISGRLLQISRFTRELRKGNALAAWMELNLENPFERRPPKRYLQTKTFSGRFLEAHLGWEPLIKDIYSSIDVLQSPIKTSHVQASVRAPFEGHLETPYRIWSPTASYPSPQSAVFYNRVKGTISVRMGANVAVSNPNLWLANQLGLLNPVQTLWAITPLSMFADWIVNVSQVLNSMTDFVGLSVSGGYTTVVTNGSQEKRLQRHFRWYNNGWTSGGGANIDSSATFKGLDRTVGLATPSLIFQPYKVPSLARAATAAAVLVGLLPRK